MRAQPKRTHFEPASFLAVAAVLLVLLITSCGPGGSSDLGQPEHGEPWGAGHTLEHVPGAQGEVKSLTLPGPDGAPFTLTYEVIGGLAVFQGDMLLGTAEELAALEDADGLEVQGTLLYPGICWTFLGATIRCEHYRWPDAVVPYAFANDWDDPGHAGDENAIMGAAIRGAMDEIERVSAIRFVPRTSQDDYLRFHSGEGCSSFIGRRGGKQDVELHFDCRNTFIVAHELLHALGFNHEQSRKDRDSHVRIEWDNIRPEEKHNFVIADHSFDVGPYDHESVMHYGDEDFCRRANGRCVGKTITTIPAGIPIGQLTKLSDGDIMALNLAYRGEPPTVSITSPVAGAEFPRGYGGVYAEAYVYDPEGKPVSLTWSSDVSGVVATGNMVVIDARRLAYGPHVLTAQAVDQQGNVARATVNLVVTNEPPSVEILRPAPGTFCANEPVEFQARAVDRNEVGYVLPGSAISWRVAGGATFATGGTVSRSFAATGPAEVVARATDERGAFAEASVTVDVSPCTDLPPTVSISAPSDNSMLVYDGFDGTRGLWYKDLALAGSASDPEDGGLGGAALVWTTDQTGLQDALLGTGATVLARLYGDQCGGVLHTIRLTATDSNGNVRSDQVRVSVYTVC